MSKSTVIVPRSKDSRGDVLIAYNQDEESIDYFFDQPPPAEPGEPRFTLDHPDPFYEPDYAFLEKERRKIIASYGFHVGCSLACFQFLTLILAATSLSLSYHTMSHDQEWNAFIGETKMKLKNFFGHSSPKLGTAFYFNLTQFLNVSKNFNVVEQYDWYYNRTVHLVRPSLREDIFTRDLLEEKIFMRATTAILISTFLVMIIEVGFFRDRNLIKTMIISCFDFVCSLTSFALSILMVVSVAKLNQNVLKLTDYPNRATCSVTDSVFCLCLPRMHGLLDSNTKEVHRWINDNNVCQMGDQKLFAAVVSWINSFLYAVTATSCLYYFYSTAELNERQIPPMYQPPDIAIDNVIEVRAIHRQKHLQDLEDAEQARRRARKQSLEGKAILQQL